MVAERTMAILTKLSSCSLAKISMVAEHPVQWAIDTARCSLAKISMVAEPCQRQVKP